VVLSKREKYIATTTIGLVAALAIYYIVIGPYLDRYDELQTERATAIKTQGDNNNLLLLQAKKTDGWNAMLKNGLEADYSTAQSRTQQMLQNWARDAQINIENVSSEPVSVQKSDFQVINFNLDFNTQGDQAMRHIARFLWSIESAAIPIRLSDIHFQSTREGTDQLGVKLVVSALYMPPKNQNSTNNGAGEILNEMENFQ
jgi:hypothetical protein